MDFQGDEVLPYGASVLLVRPLRKPSPNIVVQGQDGKAWAVPMTWLIHETEEAAMREAMRRARQAHSRQRLEDALLARRV